MSLLNPGSYFSLTVGTTDPASTGAYYSLSPTSNLTISQGSAMMAPSAPSQQMVSVSVYPQTLQINAPAGLMNGGVTIVTTASEVAGRLLISPPVNVAVAVTLYGNGGAQLGQAIADPGADSVVFKFPVTPGEGIPAGESADALRTLVEKK